MKIKKDEALNLLALICNKSIEETANIIINELTKRSIFEDMPDYWGEIIFNIIPEDVNEYELKCFYSSVSDMLECPFRYLSHYVNDLTIIGDGNCPICGGNLEVTDGEYKEVFVDYDSENMLITIWEELTCNVCGYKTTNNN